MRPRRRSRRSGRCWSPWRRPRHKRRRIFFWANVDFHQRNTEIAENRTVKKIVDSLLLRTLPLRPVAGPAPAGPAQAGSARRSPAAVPRLRGPRRHPRRRPDPLESHQRSCGARAPVRDGDGGPRRLSRARGTGSTEAAGCMLTEIRRSAKCRQHKWAGRGARENAGPFAVEMSTFGAFVGRERRKRTGSKLTIRWRRTSFASAPSPSSNSGFRIASKSSRRSGRIPRGTKTVPFRPDFVDATPIARIPALVTDDGDFRLDEDSDDDFRSTSTTSSAVSGSVRRAVPSAGASCPRLDCDERA